MITFKQFLEGSSNRAFSRGYRDDEDVQYITRRKGRKLQRNIVVKESVEFTKENLKEFIKMVNGNSNHLVSHVKFEGMSFQITHNEDELVAYESIGSPSYSFHLYRNAQHQTYLISIYKDIRSIYHTREKMVVIDPKLFLEDYLDINRDFPLSKDLVIRELLKKYKKMDDHDTYFTSALEAAKELGYDGPEIQAIEKSSRSTRAA